MHNGFKKNITNNEFPLGGNLLKSVQTSVNSRLNQIENNNRDSNDQAFVRLADHKVTNQAARLNVLGLANKGDYLSPKGGNDPMGQNPLYKSQPDLRGMSNADEEPKDNQEGDILDRTAPHGYMKSHAQMDQGLSQEFSHGIEKANKDRSLQNAVNTNYSNRRQLY